VVVKNLNDSNWFEFEFELNLTYPELSSGLLVSAWPPLSRARPHATTHARRLQAGAGPPVPLTVAPVPHDIPSPSPPRGHLSTSDPPLLPLPPDAPLKGVVDAARPFIPCSLPSSQAHHEHHFTPLPPVHDRPSEARCAAGSEAVAADCPLR
jgi:hypothetical protein